MANVAEKRSEGKKTNLDLAVAVGEAGAELVQYMDGPSPDRAHLKALEDKALDALVRWARDACVIVGAVLLVACGSSPSTSVDDAGPACTIDPSTEQAIPTPRTLALWGDCAEACGKFPVKVNTIDHDCFPADVPEKDSACFESCRTAGGAE